MSDNITPKKVLLVTLWGYRNFGNRLQAIALKRMIEQCGYAVECVPNGGLPITSRIKGQISRVVGRFVSGPIKDRYYKELRSVALHKSSDLWLKPYTKEIVSYDTISIRTDEYFAAITGSDQVWHRWSRCDGELCFFYLSFMPKFKRISYAASFGHEDLPADDLSSHIEGLNGLSSISCREESGCNIVRKLTSREAKLVLDPTLCLDTDFWSGIEEKPRYKLPTKYMLVMMLGKDEDYLSAIEKYAQSNNLTIISLMDKGRKDVWTTSIGNFLWLINNAAVICTDSFHCTVFSILYNKRFKVFRRVGAGFDKMFGRIDTLLEIAKIEDSVYESGELCFSNYDADLANASIENMRKDSLEWLKNALSKVEMESNEKPD